MQESRRDVAQVPGLLERATAQCHPLIGDVHCIHLAGHAQRKQPSPDHCSLVSARLEQA
jgi:hypothetical protein